MVRAESNLRRKSLCVPDARVRRPQRDQRVQEDLRAPPALQPRAKVGDQEENRWRWARAESVRLSALSGAMSDPVRPLASLERLESLPGVSDQWGDRARQGRKLHIRRGWIQACRPDIAMCVRASCFPTCLLLNGLNRAGEPDVWNTVEWKMFFKGTWIKDE